MKNILATNKKKNFIDQDFNHDNLNLRLIERCKTKIMKMKPKFILTIALLLAISLSSFAQNKDKVTKKAKIKSQEVGFFYGKVVSLSNNDDYIYDGFYLQTSNEKYLVKFPTKKGRILTTAFKTDTNITVIGFAGLTPQGEKDIKLVGIKANGINIYDSLPIIKVVAQKDEYIKDSAKIIEFQRDNKGKIKGYILDNKTILHLPKHVRKDLHKLLVIGTNITYTGITQVLKRGEIAVVNFNIINCKTITINKIQYLIK